MQDRSAHSNTWTPQVLPPRKQTLRQRIMAPIGVLLFVACLVGLVVYTAPVLLSDWQVQGTAQPVADGRIQDGSCTTNIVFAICDMTLQNATPAGLVSRGVNYVFIDFHLGDFQVQVMADPAHPDLLTTDLGLDRLLNRTFTLLAGIALFVSLPVLWARVVLRRRRAARMGMAR